MMMQRFRRILSLGATASTKQVLSVLLSLLLLIGSARAAAAAAAATSSSGVDYLGTTLVAVKFDGGVVVGADSRTSRGGGSYVTHATAHKIVPLTAHTVVARSGSAAVTQELANRAFVLQQNRFHRYDDTLSNAKLAHWFRNEVYDHHQESSSKDPSNVVGLLVAGYDCQDGCGRIFTVAPSGAIIEDGGSYATMGSGSTFALGYLDQTYPTNSVPSKQATNGANDVWPPTVNDKEACGSLSEQSAIDLCRKAIEGSIRRDGSSGGLIRLHILTAMGRREVTFLPGSAGTNQNDSADMDEVSNRSQTLSGFADATVVYPEESQGHSDL
jgi:20S proteasome subunit beta 1